MALVINTNVASLQAGRSVSKTRQAMEGAMERLASGKRINSASDDAAGIAVSARMKSQIDGLNMAVRNANDGISLARTAEGTLDEVDTMLHRMRELAIQAANGTYADTDRGYLNEEFSRLIIEIERVATQSKWGQDVGLTDGTNSSLEIQVGLDSGHTIAISLVDVSTSALGISALAINTQSGAVGTLSTIDVALDTINAARAKLGAAANRLEHTVSNLMSMVQHTEESKSRVMDADFAAESAALARAQILAQAGTAMLAQANQAQQYVLNLLRGS
jgi:flagellin